MEKKEKKRNKNRRLSNLSKEVQSLMIKLWLEGRFWSYPAVLLTDISWFPFTYSLLLFPQRKRYIIPSMVLRWNHLCNHLPTFKNTQKYTFYEQLTHIYKLWKQRLEAYIPNLLRVTLRKGEGVKKRGHLTFMLNFLYYSWFTILC